jgi:hypothetical protein
MPAPICLAMVVCDDYRKDSVTNKYTLIGTFSALSAPGYPMAHPQITIYTALTDGHGLTALRLEMIDVDEEREPVFQFTGNVTFDNPTNVVEMCFKTPEVTIPEAGVYRLRLFADDEFIMERWIVATQSKAAVGHDERWN